MSSRSRRGRNRTPGAHGRVSDDWRCIECVAMPEEALDGCIGGKLVQRGPRVDCPIHGPADGLRFTLAGQRVLDGLNQERAGAMQAEQPDPMALLRAERHGSAIHTHQAPIFLGGGIFGGGAHGDGR